MSPSDIWYLRRVPKSLLSHWRHLTQVKLSKNFPWHPSWCLSSVCPLSPNTAPNCEASFSPVYKAESPMAVTWRRICGIYSCCTPHTTHKVHLQNQSLEKHAPSCKWKNFRGEEGAGWGSWTLMWNSNGKHSYTHIIKIQNQAKGMESRCTLERNINIDIIF